MTVNSVCIDYQVRVTSHTADGSNMLAAKPVREVYFIVYVHINTYICSDKRRRLLSVTGLYICSTDCYYDNPQSSGQILIKFCATRKTQILIIIIVIIIIKFI